MSKISKPLFKSPLLGAVFLTLLFIIYIFLFVVSFNSLGNDIASLFKVLPIIFIFFTAISYLVSVPLNFFLYQKMENDLKKTSFFINMALLVGFLISLAIATTEYTIHHILAKSYFIVIGMSLMTTINANYFLVLAKIITIKEKKDDKEQ